jgi:hypothetical protein
MTERPSGHTHHGPPSKRSWKSCTLVPRNMAGTTGEKGCICLVCGLPAFDTSLITYEGKIRIQSQGCIIWHTPDAVLFLCSTL